MTKINELNQRVLLVILDGFGINPDSPKNAVKDASTPNLDNLFKNYPYTNIHASGKHVGLPDGVFGNSEVGHLNLGAGRKVKQDLVKINDAITDNSLEKMDLIRELIQKTKNGSKRVHLMGLLSDGGVHSHINHIKAVIDILNKEGDINIYFHAFMDGRDTQRDSGIKYVKELNKSSNFTFSSMQGRFFGMDRDKRYDRVEQGYKTLTGKGKIENISPEEYIKSEYEKEIYDEFVTPILFNKKGKIENNDTLFFLNFRPDRASELTQAFTKKDFDEFENIVRPSFFLCMTPYIQNEIKLPVLFDKDQIKNGITEYLSSKEIKSYKTAETEKFAHVTYFFNGGKKEVFENEDRTLIPSPKEVKTYDQKPEMSAIEVTDNLLKKLNDDSIGFFTVNYANCDMVGHTGVYEAAVKAVETVDNCISRVITKCEEKNICMLLTADHGNSDQMEHNNGTPHTAHTTAMVPVSLFSKKIEKGNFDIKVTAGEHALKDIAPTVLNIMGIAIPKDFTGKSIFI